MGYRVGEGGAGALILRTIIARFNVGDGVDSAARSQLSDYRTASCRRCPFQRAVAPTGNKFQEGTSGRPIICASASGGLNEGVIVMLKNLHVFALGSVLVGSLCIPLMSSAMGMSPGASGVDFC